jgi:ELP3 family radical SAM enzyme/protein acetyltransferase
MPCSLDIENLSSNAPLVSVEQQSFKKHISPSKEKLVPFVREFLDLTNKLKTPNKTDITRLCDKLKAQHKITPSKHDIRKVVELQLQLQQTQIPKILTNWMVKSAVRLNSGVLVVTITLSPTPNGSKFTCKYDCSYCPQETDLKGNPTQPRSYLSTEPAMMRGLEADFDIRGQFKNRVESYIYTGSINNKQAECYKMEVRLVGGTFESYPKDYREQVMREVYWAGNTIGQDSDRPCNSLDQEILENETARYRIIGLTVETRPDNITPESIRDYCRWGVTRVEIGVQHFSDVVLKKNNRKCYLADTKRAIGLLKQCAFKVHVHLMPDLPGSSPDLDKWMFDQALSDPDLQFDDLKIYTCAVIKSASDDLIVKSKIADWYADGSYKPYSESNLDALIDVLSYYKQRVPPHIRITRVIRDVPSKSIEAGYNKTTNLRQVIQNKLHDACKCLFCKEIGEEELGLIEPTLVVRSYDSSGGKEYFISVEWHNMDAWQQLSYNLFRLKASLIDLFTGQTIYWNAPTTNTHYKTLGFLRLRLDPNAGGTIISEINNHALIRELHVYGPAQGVTDSTNSTITSQHRGYGQLMMKTAETIALQNGYTKAAVIAGVGVRKYYEKKCGYTKGQTYMLKNLVPVQNSYFWLPVLALSISAAFYYSLK